jgi:membrane-bound ClpP family serine protease
MQNARLIFLVLSIALHSVAVIILAVLLYAAGMMAAFCIVPAVLVGCASVPTLPGRPANLYVAFGLLIGFSFWYLVSAVNQRDWLAIMLVLLVVVGSVWLLSAPSWPSVGFAGVAILFCLGLGLVMLTRKTDFEDPVPDRARRSGLTTIGILVIASAYTGMGFAEVLVRKTARKAKKKKMRRPVKEHEGE